MISLSTYIRENLDGESNIFKNIDPTEFEWHPSYSDDDYQTTCKKEVLKIAAKLYPNISPMDRIEELYKDTYKLYCKTNPKAKDSDIEDKLAKHLKTIRQYGWGTFERNGLEQGWWVFIKWAYEKVS